MHTVQEIIAAAVKLRLTPELRKAGYRKSGRTFHKVDDDCTKVLNLQFSKHNTKKQGSFTINLGIHFPALHQLAEWVPFSGPPKEYQCEVRMRIGYLMADKKDGWWMIDSTTSIERLGQELREAWENYARPWLDRNCSLRNAAGELESREQYFMAAAAQLLLGDRERSHNLILFALTKYPRAANRTRDWARKHDLLV